jgi:hypothetical protein
MAEAVDLAIDFGGLANQAPRATEGYTNVRGPKAARDDADTGYEASNFELKKPLTPFIMTYRRPITVSPLL